ncbi:MAG: hypothetical protein PF690_07425 [Deltaproteobacteria bacterium]|jgi:hypothetical protein|nr:hypothetical protein [Deltaproteobacteria bacterium]
MKKRNNITAKICLFMLLLAFLAMIALPFQAWATDDDFDNDGLYNEDVESVCLPLLTDPLSTDPQAQECFATDPDRPDLFILLLRAEPTLLPYDPDNIENPDYPAFEFISNESEWFNINVHVIDVTQAPDQKISNSTPPQYAVGLIEDQRTTDGELGISQVGIPTKIISGRVFSYRIREDVENACNEQDPEKCDCVNSDGEPYYDENGNPVTGIDQIVTIYQKNVLAHEIFHMLNRVYPVNKKVDYHYAQLGYIMDHHMTYKAFKKEKKVTWYINDKWAKADVPVFK